MNQKHIAGGVIGALVVLPVVMLGGEGIAGFNKEALQKRLNARVKQSRI